MLCYECGMRAGQAPRQGTRKRWTGVSHDQTRTRQSTQKQGVLESKDATLHGHIQAPGRHSPNGGDEGRGERVLGEAQQQATLPHTCARPSDTRHLISFFPHTFLARAGQRCALVACTAQLSTCLAAYCPVGKAESGGSHTHRCPQSAAASLAHLHGIGKQCTGWWSCRADGMLLGMQGAVNCRVHGRLRASKAVLTQLSEHNSPPTRLTMVRFRRHVRAQPRDREGQASAVTPVAAFLCCCSALKDTACTDRFLLSILAGSWHVASSCLLLLAVLLNDTPYACWQTRVGSSVEHTK